MNLLPRDYGCYVGGIKYDRKQQYQRGCHPTEYIALENASPIKLINRPFLRSKSYRIDYEVDLDDNRSSGIYQNYRYKILIILWAIFNILTEFIYKWENNENNRKRPLYNIDILAFTMKSS